LQLTFCLLKAASILFISSGIWFSKLGEQNTQGNIIVDLVEIVHLFLVGTVLFLTSLGIYELFIQPLPLPPWLKTHNIEELELNLVGLTIVVLAVNFLSVIFEEKEINLAIYGIGYALPITALAYFMKVRSQIKGNETENRKDSNEWNSQGYEESFKAMEGSFEAMS
jgi:uncharacterized membrane protein YqhA